MFADHPLVNLAIFALGSGVAVVCLRTGLVLRGAGLLIILLVAADVALVRRIVFTDDGPAFTAALATMQVTALVAVTWLVLAGCRRRWSADGKRHQELFAAGLRHYLRDELPEARTNFERIRRTDPWDTAALVALANVTWRQGQVSRARSLYRAARRLDRNRSLTDFIDLQLRRSAEAAQSDAP